MSLDQENIGVMFTRIEKIWLEREILARLMRDDSELRQKVDGYASDKNNIDRVKARFGTFRLRFDLLEDQPDIVLDVLLATLQEGPALLKG